MKRLTREEFNDRARALLKARKIFIPHFTKNISIAFELYQGMLAEEERQLTLTVERERDYNGLSLIERPLCPLCGERLGLALVNAPKGKKNRFGYKSLWFCDTEDCTYEKFSRKTLKEWIKELPKKEGEANGTG